MHDAPSVAHYNGPGGYKYRLKLISESSGFTLNMYIASVPGRFDDSLEWPAKGRINLVLCDQKQRRD